MPTPVPLPIRHRLFAALLSSAALAQDPPVAGEPPQPAPAPHFVVLRYPADRAVPVAEVGGQPLTLGQLVDHLDEKHHPGFRQALETQPGVQRYLTSDLIAPWVRHFADLQALRLATRDQGIDETKLREAQQAGLKKGFEAWLGKEAERRRTSGLPAEFTQKQIDRMLADWQLRNGLGVELQGWLDHLEPDTYTRAQMMEFFNANARAFGGQVKFAHILVQHRDAGTGILLADEGRARASARLADIRARLLPDGSNFAEVARLCSEDTRTAPEGGVVGFVHRFDDRMPAVLCRAAWFLRDGETSDVVESQYGWHLVQRLDFQQHIFVLFTDDAIPTIRQAMRRARQEDWLFKVRDFAKIKLLL